MKTTISPDTLKHILVDRYLKNATYKSLAVKYGYSAGYLCRLVKGQQGATMCVRCQVMRANACFAIDSRVCLLCREIEQLLEARTIEVCCYHQQVVVTPHERGKWCSKCYQVVDTRIATINHALYLMDNKLLGTSKDGIRVSIDVDDLTSLALSMAVASCESRHEAYILQSTHQRRSIYLSFLWELLHIENLVASPAACVETHQLVRPFFMQFRSVSSLKGRNVHTGEWVEVAIRNWKTEYERYFSFLKLTTEEENFFSVEHFHTKVMLLLDDPRWWSNFAAYGIRGYDDGL